MLKCPKCGSKNLIPIMYGMPAWNEELERDLKEKKVVLGGCCIYECMPKYLCDGCKKRVGTPPVVKGKKCGSGPEDYRDVVEEIRFSDGGFFGGYREVGLYKKSDGTFAVQVRPDMVTFPRKYVRELSHAEWDKVLEKLYGRLFLHEWKKRFVNPHILDGEQWELELRLYGNRKRSYYGSNDFPPLWKELKAVFAPFFKEAEKEKGQVFSIKHE